MSIAATQGILCGRYTLLGKLGTGGQAEVWRARDLLQGGELALKILLPAVATDAAAWAALEREHAIASRLDHPLILKVWAPLREGTTAVLPMEFAPGGDLRRLRGVSYLEIVPVLLEVASALEHAHVRGVVHRDLKPGNVLFDARGHVRLADFGIAGTVLSGATEPARLATAGRVAVSPFTASPEQLRGEPPAVTDDVYGIGALAYELLSGYPPFYPRFDLKRVLEEPVPELKTVYQAPPRLVALIMGMLAKRAARRPPSMRVIIDELGATLNDTLTFDYATDGGTAEPPLPPRETPALEQASRTVQSPDFTVAPWAADLATRIERASLTLVPRAPARPERATPERATPERATPERATPEGEAPAPLGRAAREEKSDPPAKRSMPLSRITHFEPVPRIPSLAVTEPPPQPVSEAGSVPELAVPDAKLAVSETGAPALDPKVPVLAQAPPVDAPAMGVPAMTPTSVASADFTTAHVAHAAPLRAPTTVTSALSSTAAVPAQTAPAPQPPPERLLPPETLPTREALDPHTLGPWADLKIEAVPSLMRVEPVKHRRWPTLLLLALAAAAIAAFFWLPRVAP
ncbi:MAG TPA: protein kinase, partial [Steroidobacteraceae bacterium]|nr:protein kinase [Steroidobacteraceae bacterium]